MPAFLREHKSSTVKKKSFEYQPSLSPPALEHYTNYDRDIIYIVLIVFVQFMLNRHLKLVWKARNSNVHILHISVSIPNAFSCALTGF